MFSGGTERGQWHAVSQLQFLSLNVEKQVICQQRANDSYD